MYNGAVGGDVTRSDEAEIVASIGGEHHHGRSKRRLALVWVISGAR